MPKAAAPPRPRIRRTAEDARAAILDATEKRLVDGGIAGIRLKEVADDVGVSHPTVLHHFGSREGLVDAVIARRVESMNLEVFAALAKGIADPDAVHGLFERLAAYFGEGGHARVVAFLALEGRRSPIEKGTRPLADALHAARVARAAVEGVAPPSYEDSYFVVLLVSFALFGEAIAARIFQANESATEVGRIGRGFRAWFASLVRAHLETESRWSRASGADSAVSGAERPS